VRASPVAKARLPLLAVALTLEVELQVRHSVVIAELLSAIAMPTFDALATVFAVALQATPPHRVALAKPTPNAMLPVAASTLTVDEASQFSQRLTRAVLCEAARLTLDASAALFEIVPQSSQSEVVAVPIPSARLPLSAPA